MCKVQRISIGVMFLAAFAFLAVGTAALAASKRGDEEPGPTASFSTSAAVSRAATTGSVGGPFTAVDLRGGGTTPGSQPGACTGTTCTASSGNCECKTITATLLGTGVGKVSATLNLTVDDDDTFPSGSNDALCYPISGPGTFTTSGKNPSQAVLALSGLECQSFISTAFTLGGTLNYVQEPALGPSGKFIDAFGTGSLSFLESVDEAAGGVEPVALSLTGTMQKKH